MDHAKLQSVENLPEWLPGNITFESRSRECPDILLRGFNYRSLEAKVPPMMDYTIALFHTGVGQISNMAHGRWNDATVHPGDVTIMTRGEDTQWRWNDAIKVTHLYLTHSALNEVATSTFSEGIEGTHLPNVLRTEDPTLRRIIQMLYNELCADMLGVDLLLETLQVQLCVHLLRNYATFQTKEVKGSGRLTRAQREDVISFVRENIHRKITLGELSSLLKMSTSQTIRTFRTEFACTPHAYVLRQRFSHAKSLIKKMPDAPLKMVAVDSGFSDQSHMTRVFQRLLQQSPGSYRASCLRKLPSVQASHSSSARA